MYAGKDKWKSSPLPALVTSCLFKITALDLFPTVLSSLPSTDDGLDSENGEKLNNWISLKGHHQNKTLQNSLHAA